MNPKGFVDKQDPFPVPGSRKQDNQPPSAYKESEKDWRQIPGRPQGIEENIRTGKWRNRQLPRTA